MAVFKIENLTFCYPEQSIPALQNLQLCVQQGDFLVICGASGCGKSTLLRQLKTVLAPHGTRTGRILFEGEPLETVDSRIQAGQIGFVLQSPENQIVTDKVWHELAFSMESLGFDTPIIRRRTAEMAAFFGIEEWFYKEVSTLSGGQKQLLNLASVMALQPKVLLLDEPTSQLDPIASSDFLAALGRINRELGTTVILTEHRLEEAFPLANRVAVMEQGRILCQGAPEEVGQLLRAQKHPMFLAMPAAMRIWASVDTQLSCPVTVRQGYDFLRAFLQSNPAQPLPQEQIPACGEEVIIAKDVWYRYEKDTPDVVKGLNLSVHKGEIFALLGGNGVGKTTALGTISGVRSPYRGKVTVRGTLAALPQNPQALFVKKTVREDLQDMCSDTDTVAWAVGLCKLTDLLDRHPFDLSGGEQQRAALAKLLLLRPEILLLDEPTKGMDAEFKVTFAGILQQLTAQGVTVCMVSHDVEFCAKYAHRCALLFDGSIVAQDTPRAFFSGNSFYTTSANRMARTVEPNAVTVEDVIAVLGGVVPPEPTIEQQIPPLPPATESAAETPAKLSWWKKLLSAVFGCVALLMLAMILGLGNWLGLESLVLSGRNTIPFYLAFVLDLWLLTACIRPKSRQSAQWRQLPKEKRRLSKRTLLSATFVLLLIPATLWAGIFYLQRSQYNILALAILLEAMIPFFLVFEGKKPQARELVILAVLCAIGIAGRAVLFALPQFKPVMALTILAGVAFGGEAGFLVGGVTMLASNMLFGQGPWTLWQMFCMGIIGFLSGVLYRKGILRRGRGSLAVFGAVAAIFIFGGLINPSYAIVYNSGNLSWKILLPYYISGLPMDCVQAAATALFLYLGAGPLLDKLDRIKLKYGLEM